MEDAIIRKPVLSDIRVKPNLVDFGGTPAKSPWDVIEQELDWLPGGYLNKAYECIDRHALGPCRDKPALLWEGKEGETETYTFSELKEETDKFANVLTNLGIKHGDRVFLFMERVPELYIATFGTLKIGAVAGPLFSAFGPEPVKDRLLDSGSKVLVTQPSLRRRIKGVISDLPDLEKIIVVNKHGRDPSPLVDGDLSYETLMSEASTEFEIFETCMNDYSIMHYTSGTTGKPKGAVHRHYAIVQQYATGKWVLDLHEDDIYWCTADPGWVTGTSYGMLAPWSNGVTQLIHEGGFHAGTWYNLIQKYKVSVWYTAPTAIRMLMKAGDEVPRNYDLSSLRHINSVGEPLNPEAITWGRPVFNQAIHDNWWQTETGAILIANYAAMDVRPGSMGRPIPGIEAAVLDDNYDPLPPDQDGKLAIRPGWPSMFQTYWRNSELYNSRFRKGWYLTGDQARVDKDGYYWFVGRADDVINTAGHLVGPFEVESVLLEHPSVVEAGVIGKPDPIAMEIVKAFVALKNGVEPTDELLKDIQRFTRKKLAAAVAPREIEFLRSLPKTRSGKIMRRLLKARELGLPEGDTSTLEED
ncbi:MAG: acetate--CoA ligase [Proteobacteria bacterium]|nr:acetate--CoA ligase [Pseudomonadota bacterium]